VKHRVARGTARLKLLGTGVWNLTVSIARDIRNELKLLNDGGAYHSRGVSTSRRRQAREFKAALAQRYSQNTRCC
jgi:hypothetical protein